MGKIHSIEDLQVIRKRVKAGIEKHNRPDDPQSLVHVRIEMATCGIAAGARPIMEFFTEQLERRNINGLVTQSGGMGYCYAEPTVEITLPGKDPIVFGEVDIKKADEIIEKYIKTGELVDGIIPVNYEKIDLTQKEV